MTDTARPEFDPARFDLVSDARVHIADHRYGHNRTGDLDVWTVDEEGGTAFVRQLTVGGTPGPLSQGVYSLACSFLREKASGRYFFLERSDRGFTIQSAAFLGAEAYMGARGAAVTAWLESRNAA